MLPISSNFPDEDILALNKKPAMSGLTHRMHPDNNNIYGRCDLTDSVMQSVYKILNTERYRYLIYSEDYGIELEELMGRPVPYVMAELPYRIKDALLCDDRIVSADNFNFDTPKRHVLCCEFTVNTIYGSFNVKKEVKI